MRILLVEDDTLIGDGIRAGLSKMGFSVDWFTDGKTGQAALGTLGKNSPLGVAKKQATNDFAGAANHRHGQIAAHREMAFRHAAAGRVLAVARILRYVV